MKLTVEISDEDRKAGVTGIYNTYGEVKGQDPLDDEAMRRFVIEPAIQHKLHMNRSALRWGKFEVWKKVPKTEEGHTYTKVTTEDGKEHHVMMPNGRMRAPHVFAAAEGMEDCETSPTKLCWYDNQRDPRWDCCLFCNDPHTRK